MSSILEQTKAINDYSSARSQASNLASSLNSLLGKYSINPSQFNAINQFIQKIGGNTSSPEYQEFSNLVNDLAAVYANILTPPGGNATDMTRTIAQSLISSSASGQSISQVVSGLDQQAQQKISGIQNNVGTLINGGNVNPGSNASANANTYVSPSGVTYKLPN